MAQQEWTIDEVEIVVRYFKEELDGVRTGDDLEDFIKSINKGKVKQFLENNLQQGADDDREGKDFLEEKALEKEALKDKVNNI